MGTILTRTILRLRDAPHDVRSSARMNGRLHQHLVHLQLIRSLGADPLRYHRVQIRIVLLAIL